MNADDRRGIAINRDAQPLLLVLLVLLFRLVFSAARLTSFT